MVLQVQHSLPSRDLPISMWSIRCSPLVCGLDPGLQLATLASLQSRKDLCCNSSFECQIYILVCHRTE
jgi:hypothetical protein